MTIIVNEKYYFLLNFPKQIAFWIDFLTKSHMINRKFSVTVYFFLLSACNYLFKTEKSEKNDQISFRTFISYLNLIWF